MFIYWRASEASETVLGVDNAKSGICYMYVWMVRILFKRARQELFSPKKKRLFRLDSCLYKQPYFILKLQSVRKFLRKRMLFKKQKVDSTGYYGIETLYQILIQNFAFFPDKCGLLVVKSHL